MDALKIVAELMALSARTAPKSSGIDDIVIRVLDGADVAKLGEDMASFGQRHNLPKFDRDGGRVKACGAVILVGLRKANPLGHNCGACGFPDCASLSKASPTDIRFLGPHCMFKLLDLGIALGSAVKTASILNADNRIMYRIGAAAREAGWIDAAIVMGVPLSATGKNIFFDSNK